MNANGSLPQWLTFGALVVACILFAVGGVGSVESPGGELTVGREADGASRDVARLAAAVERLESVLASGLGSREEPRTGVTPSESAGGGARAGESKPSGDAPALPGRPPGRNPEMTRLLGVETRTEVVAGLIQGSPNLRAVQRALLLSSYREVLERFGFPSSIGTTNSGVRFGYLYTRSDGARRTMYLYFVDGIVVAVFL